MCADRENGPARVLLVTAIREELGAFAGRRLDPGVIAAATGDGLHRAAEAAAALCRRYRPAMLLGAGVAGALSADLDVGDLIVGRHVRDSAGEAPPPDPELLSRAVAMPGIRAGTFLSVDRPVVTAAEKAQWAERVGSAPATVDMESAAWARVAAAQGIPYLIIRTVSDAAFEELPAYLTECLGKEGGIRRSAVALHALTQPASIPTLLRMRRRVAECGARLADFVEYFLKTTREVS